MVSGKSEEHAALVALLQAQPDGLSWPEIAAELLEVGSAVEVWERHAPAPALIDLPGQVTVASAAEDVRSWAAQGYRLISILDEDYPARLRGIHQAPPVIFTLGTVLADDPAVSSLVPIAASRQHAVSRPVYAGFMTVTLAANRTAGALTCGSRPHQCSLSSGRG